MPPVRLLSSAGGNLLSFGNIRYHSRALSPKLKLRLSVIPKELYSFRPKSPLEDESTYASTFEPVRTNGNSKSDQAVALCGIAKDGVAIDPVLHNKKLCLTEIFEAQRKLLSLAMRQ